MKTTPPAHCANVVNASITIFFHSVQPIKAAPPRASPAGRDWRGAMLEVASREAVGSRFKSGRSTASTRSAPRSRPSGAPLPWRSRARGGIAAAVPAAGAGVDGAIVRPAAFITGVKGENRSQASRLGACGRRGARRRRGVANRGIGLPPATGPGGHRRRVAESRALLLSQ